MEPLLAHSNAARETKSRKNTIFVGRLKYQLIESLLGEKKFAYTYSGVAKAFERERALVFVILCFDIFTLCQTQ